TTAPTQRRPLPCHYPRTRASGGALGTSRTSSTALQQTPSADGIAEGLADVERPERLQRLRGKPLVPRPQVRPVVLVEPVGIVLRPGRRVDRREEEVEVRGEEPGLGRPG